MNSELRWPKPLSPIAYVGAVGDLVRTLEPTTEADPAALLFNGLAMLGNLIGRGPHFRAEADQHFTNIDIADVGETSKGRKGVSRSTMKQVFAVVDPEWAKDHIVSGLSSGEGLVWSVRDAIEKRQPIKDRGRILGYETVVEDPGVTDKRLFVEEPEFASVLKVMARQGNTLSPVIRQAWDGQDLRILTKNSPARSTAPHISLVVHITRDELRRYLDVTEMANGLANRFLWVCVRRSKELPDGGGAPDLVGHVRVLQRVVEQGRQVGEMRRDAEAADYWRRVYGPLSAGRPGMLGAVTGRAEAQVMRLACLVALGDMSYVVALPHLRAALELWRYCFESAGYLFGDQLGDPVADEILRALREEWPASLTRSQITRDLFGRNRSAIEVNRAFKLLVDNRLAVCERDRSGEGRPVERWVAVKPTGDDINELNDKTPATEGGYVVNAVNVVGREPAREADADRL